jgi:peptidoglycan hydrolase CwlO-like protein
MAERGRSAGCLIRWSFRPAVALLVLAGLLAVPRAATADVTGELDQATARLARLKHQVKDEQVQLDALSAQAGALAAKRDQAQAGWEQITEELNLTRASLGQARQRYLELQAQLAARAREAYMDGPGTDVEFLLGAASLTDLSDRIVFVEALAQGDADLVNEVRTVRSELSTQAQHEAELQVEAADALGKLNDATAALEAKLEVQQQIIDDIDAKIARAEELVKTLGRQYQDSLASFTGLEVHPDAVLQVCPVDQPRAIYDGFGAPRYAGGYHPHAGNDIVAPMGTQIRSPFDGVAVSSWNSLGGNSEYVYGAEGYVYNAHLSGYADLSDGPVHAGDVIGYVGNTGDAQGGVTHDHFEWHPKVIPQNWAVSPYGYRVIGSALNPYPLLQQVC